MPLLRSLWSWALHKVPLWFKLQNFLWSCCGVALPMQSGYSPLLFAAFPRLCYSSKILWGSRNPRQVPPTHLIPTNSQMEKEQTPEQLWPYDHPAYRDEFGAQVHFSGVVGYVSQRNGSVVILDQIWKKRNLAGFQI